MSLLKSLKHHGFFEMVSNKVNEYQGNDERMRGRGLSGGDQCERHQAVVFGGTTRGGGLARKRLLPREMRRMCAIAQ